MGCRCGGTFLAPILAVAGVVAAGAAGYRVVSGGCGSCAEQSANTALVSATTDHCSGGVCPGATPECAANLEACTGEPSGCPGMEHGTSVKTVASEAKSDAKSGCCSEAKVQEVAKDGKDGCCEGEKKKDEKKSDGAVATRGN